MLARIFFFILYLFVLVNSAHGSVYERIQNYHVDIKVLETGNLEITEKIKVFATGQKIQRGIYRWFPLSNVESFQKKNPYFDLTVKRDGRTENIAKIEKSRQEDISKVIENIIILSYSVLQFINRYVNKNNELFFSNKNSHTDNISFKVLHDRN